jgi:hypothetical protein
MVANLSFLTRKQLINSFTFMRLYCRPLFHNFKGLNDFEYDLGR